MKVEVEEKIHYLIESAFDELNSDRQMMLGVMRNQMTPNQIGKINDSSVGKDTALGAAKGLAIGGGLGSIVSDGMANRGHMEDSFSDPSDFIPGLLVGGGLGAGLYGLSANLGGNNEKMAASLGANQARGLSNNFTRRMKEANYTDKEISNDMIELKTDLNKKYGAD